MAGEPAGDPSADFEKNWNITINDVLCGVYLGPSPETPGSYGITEAFDHEGAKATVWFICKWNDRLDLVQGLLGDVDYIGGTIVRQDPFVLPLAPADAEDNSVFSNRLFCTSVSSVQGIHPWTDETGETVGLAYWLGYVYAIVQAEFTTPPYLIRDLLGPGIVPGDPSFNDLTFMTYVISRCRVSGEVFAPPNGAFQFTAGGFNKQSLLDVGASQIRTRFEISCTRVRMPLVPMETITSLIGTLNTNPFQVAGQQFPRGAVLFTGVNPEPRSDQYSRGIIYDVEVTFMANGPASNQDDADPTACLDWNLFMDPSGAWSPVATPDGKTPFSYADHLELFNDAIS